ncbi:MAG TPA: AI-2E family transporter [Oligoflexia bacterium]|nr:AI-2E family transporter [Oligoflexia bacterium]HMP48053.1 AI-2E family transporter [Oligoflexia bacterium]
MSVESEYFEGFPPPWGRVAAFFTRVFVWVLFFSILYLFRSFSLLVFLTFVFSYIQSHGVSILERVSPNFVPASFASGRFVLGRTYVVIFVALLFLGVLIAIGSYLIPQVISQAELFADNFKTYLHKVDKEIVSLSETFPQLQTIIPETAEAKEFHDSISESDIGSSITVIVISQLFGFEGVRGDALDLKQLSELVRNIGKPLLAASSSFFLGLLFSFLIVLDLPRLSRSVRSLQKTRVGFIYDEVSDSIVSFGRTLGHALEAQLFIAIINTILTALAISIFGIGQKLAFLSLIVFLCSFIPVAGVFISSVPICLLALEGSGVQGLILMAFVIWGIHIIEAYVLNPKIFGNRLHINPVLVLIILTIGGKLFGIWGLLLGVPVCTYIFTDAIRYKKADLIQGIISSEDDVQSAF